MAPEIRWHCLPFAQVPPRVLYQVLALRSRVFVVEQACIYQDLDGEDLDALLVIGGFSRPRSRAPSGADADADAAADAYADTAAAHVYAAANPAADPAADPAASVDADLEVVATARVLAPGRRFREASIGRVCTSPDHRRHGLGRTLMAFSVCSTRHRHPGTGIRISAQAYLQAFYESLGFAVASLPYLEDAIWHLEMRLRPEDGAGPGGARPAT